LMRPAVAVLRSKRHLATTPQALGAAFEIHAIDLLSSLGFRLRPTQASHDGGIDFSGSFLPGSADCSVVGQCKRHGQRSVGVKVVREMESVVHRRRKEAHAPALGVIVSATTGFSPFANRLWASSAEPMMLVEADDTPFQSEDALLHNRRNCSLRDEVSLQSLRVNRAAMSMLPKLQLGTVLHRAGTASVLMYDGAEVCRWSNPKWL
jgi:hypothetical protein